MEATDFKYPSDNEIRAEWSALHIGIIILSILIIWPIFACYTDLSVNFINKLITTIGLNIDIIGVTVASLKTSFYGHFMDGGEIEIKRALVERRYFKYGMTLIALGFLLQALGTLL